jgi:hypothetical protein
MNAAAADFAYSLNLTNAIAQNYSSGFHLLLVEAQKFTLL